MTLKAQAGQAQTWSSRGRTQLLAIFVASLALLVALIGLAVASRPAIGSPAVVTPAIIRPAANQSRSTRLINFYTGFNVSATTGLDQASGLDMSAAARAALNSTRSMPVVNPYTGFNVSATTGLDQASGVDMSAAARSALNSTRSMPVVNPYTGFDMRSVAHPAILDRGADR